MKLQRLYIATLREILFLMENGIGFTVSSEAIEDKELIKAKIKEYKQNIETTKRDETYQTITELEDWGLFVDDESEAPKKEKRQEKASQKSGDENYWNELF